MQALPGRTRAYMSPNECLNQLQVGRKWHKPSTFARVQGDVFLARQSAHRANPYPPLRSWIFQPRTHMSNCMSTNLFQQESQHYLLNIPTTSKLARLLYRTAKTTAGKGGGRGGEEGGGRGRVTRRVQSLVRVNPNQQPTKHATSTAAHLPESRSTPATVSQELDHTWKRKAETEMPPKESSRSSEQECPSAKPILHVLQPQRSTTNGTPEVHCGDSPQNHCVATTKIHLWCQPPLSSHKRITIQRR